LKDKKVYEAVLEYRGSDHGWANKDFHSRADHKNWTITLFKIQDGDCVGGFTTQSWHHRGSGIYIRDDNAFLFNLSCARKFSSQHCGIDIWCYSGYGPTFAGSLGLELAARDEPFNGEYNCSSYAYNPGYYIGIETDGVTNKLTRKMNSRFTITELEVWSLKHH
jgi:hypothetical protein